MNLLVMKRQEERAEIPGFIGETFSSPSLTIPDESLSIQEILLNFTRGTLPPVSKTPQYYDEDFVDHPLDGQADDLTNREVAQEHTANLLDHLQSQQPAEAEKDTKKEPPTTGPDVNPPEPPKED